MANIRVSLFMKNNRGFGWTDTFYLDGTDLSAALDETGDLRRARRDLLGGGVFLYETRVSFDDPMRDSLIYAVPDSDQEGTVYAPLQGDYAGTSLLCRLQASPSIRRQLMLRGFPDEEVVNNGTYAPGPNFTAHLRTFFTELTLPNKWKIRTFTRVPPVRVSLTLQDPNTGVVTCTSTAAATIAAGDLVQINAGRGGGGIRGRHRVLTSDGAVSFTLQIFKLVPLNISRVTVFKVSFVLASISSAQVIRVTHRNTGRPSDAPRGRRLIRA
jgi:hypothetical protein